LDAWDFGEAFIHNTRVIDRLKDLGDIEGMGEPPLSP